MNATAQTPTITVENIRGVSVRQGRQGSVFGNMPSRREGDSWQRLVEIISPALADLVCAEVLRAVGEVTR